MVVFPFLIVRCSCSIRVNFLDTFTSSFVNASAHHLSQASAKVWNMNAVVSIRLWFVCYSIGHIVCSISYTMSEQKRNSQTTNCVVFDIVSNISENRTKFVFPSTTSVHVLSSSSSFTQNNLLFWHFSCCCRFFSSAAVSCAWRVHCCRCFSFWSKYVSLPFHFLFVLQSQYDTNAFILCCCYVCAFLFVGQHFLFDKRRKTKGDKKKQQPAMPYTTRLSCYCWIFLLCVAIAFASIISPFQFAMLKADLVQI